MSPAGTFGAQETRRRCCLLGDSMGHQLRTLRESAGMSVELAARAAGLTPSTWRALEEGCGAAVGLPTLVAAARAVGADLGLTLTTRSAAWTPLMS